MVFHPHKDLSELDELTEEHLGFSALSDGLGFSRQARKAPAREPEDIGPASQPDEELKRKALSGSGAVAAGPAMPAPGITGMARKPSAAPARNVAPAMANILMAPAASPGLRAAAFFTDVLFVLLPLGFGWWVSFREQSWGMLLGDLRTPALLFSIVLAGYFLLSESFGGQSLGKMLFRLRVVEDDKYEKPTGLSHAFSRLVIAFFGALLFGIGLFASFWDVKRRPWHDRYSGSIVRRKA